MVSVMFNHKKNLTLGLFYQNIRIEISKILLLTLRTDLGGKEIIRENLSKKKGLFFEKLVPLLVVCFVCVLKVEKIPDDENISCVRL